MTAMPTRTPHAAQRLLTPEPAGTPMPQHTLATLLDALDRSGLTGRGGAGFPTSIKTRTVAAGRRRPVIVGNALEGEPLSAKDAVLLRDNPTLVLDGLEVLVRTLRAKRGILAIHQDLDSGPVLGALGPRRIEIAYLAGGFVAGQESALVNQLNGRPALPGDPLRRVFEAGVDGRPTLVINAETLAHVALVARHGPEWYRAAGTVDDPGTSLFTIRGAVDQPGVIEAPRGSRVIDAIAPARPVYPAAVLVGGYHGAWLPADRLDARLTRTDLAPFGASVGAGVLYVLGSDSCPLAYASSVATYLATESAQQCGPCVNGLPHLADSLRALAQLRPDPAVPADVRRMARLVTGRGACAHPDGSARFISSTLTTFSDHVEAHLQGWCPHARRVSA